MVYFVDDTNRDFLQNIPRNLGEVSCHAINRSDSANRNCVVVSPAVAHDTNRSDSSINSKVLPDVAVKTSFGDFFAENSIRFADSFQFFLSDFSHDTNSKSWSWEWLAPDNFIRHTKLGTQSTHFILVERVQWLNQLKPHVFRKTTNIMVRFNSLSSVGTGFDNVCIERSLSQEFYIFQFAGFVVKDIDKLVSDDFTFLLWL